MTEIEVTCINCGTAVNSPFCGQCGQKNPSKKINLLSLYTDFQSRVYGFDGMFPRTLKDLTRIPGHVAKAYVSGNRVKYVGPVGYYFLIMTSFLLLMQIFEVDFHSFAQNNNPIGGIETEKQKLFQQQVMQLVTKNLRLFWFLLIPGNTIIAWLFFRKSNPYNLLEHSVLVFYTSGHLMWLSIINMFIFLGFSLNFSFWLIPVNTLFYAFACTSFYAGKSKTKVFMKGVAASVLSFILYICFFSWIAFAYVLSKPEFQDMFKK